MGDKNLQIIYDESPSAVNIGGNTRQIYDRAEYAQQLKQNVSPLAYMLYSGKYENCNKCVYDKFYTPFDVVDIESELSNRTRPLTRSDQYKYNPNCVASSTCLSTFDRSVPVVPSPELCPIVYNNIKHPIGPGFPAFSMNPMLNGAFIGNGAPASVRGGK
jgi:hypothetical protein